MTNNRILILGPIAPPFGGVSIHISRLINLIKDDVDLDFIDESRIIKPDYFNIRNLKPLQYFKKIKNAHLLFIHSGKKYLRVLHLLNGKIFGKKMILTIHSFTADTPKLICFLNGILYRLADIIVVVSPEIKER